MKNRAFHFQLADVFRTGQVHGRESDDLVVLVRPGSEFEKREGTPENILRWEDDGGQAFEAPGPLLQPVDNDTRRMMDAAQEPRPHDSINAYAPMKRR